jgi:chemotaxis protein MotA
VLKGALGQITALFGSGTTKEQYNDLLAMLYQIFKQVQQSGVMSLEPHFENPSQSTLLTKYPKFMARHDALDFLAVSV